MQIIHNALIEDRYDVIVVGAGIGGLTTAGLLAKKGLKVLVLEQHYLPGGCVTSLRRHDVAIDVGAAMLFGWSSKTDPHPFVMNELEEEIDMIQHESSYRMHLGNQTLTFWCDLDRFLNELITLFPHQEKEIRALYAESREIYECILNMARFPVPPTELPINEVVRMFLHDPVNMLKMQRLMSMSGEDLLNKYITDPKLANFYDFLVAVCTTCNVKESPASLVLSIILGTHIGGACYPAGSPQMFPNKLEKAIEKFGGQIVYRQMVDEILVWKDNAYGVRLADGTEIMADRVVSNADVYRLYGTLIKPKHIRPERMQWAHHFEPTPGIVLLYITAKDEAIPQNARPIEFFVNNIHDVNGGNYIVYIPSLEDPSIAPPGTHSLTVMTSTSIDWPRPTDRFYKSEEYEQLKEREAEKILDTLKKQFFPKLKKNIISLDIGTPATIERFTLKSFGSIGGPKLTTKQFFYDRLRARTEWKNLYCVGDSTSMGMGVVSTTMSGIGAANQILKDMHLPIYRPKTHAKQYVNMVPGREWVKSPDPRKPITEKTAKRIGRDCQHCHKPSCQEACPADIETSLFARRIESGNFAGAARVLREVNPLSEICGYICPAERYCEKSCSRLDFDDKPVRIRELHGWVCGHVSPFEGWNRRVPSCNGFDVAVVGAGPAGLTCAHYLARLGYRVDIFDRAEAPGGMLSQAIPELRLPMDVVQREIKGLSLTHMKFHYQKALGKDFTISDLEKEYHAIFLAPGLGAGSKLKIDGAEKAKTTDALSLLNSFRNKGKVKTGKRVLIIGGGSVAADAALVIKESGTHQVSLVCLEKEAEMPALKTEIEELKKQGVKIINGWGPQGFLSATKILLIECLSAFDKQGRFRPTFDESNTLELAFDQLVWAVGQVMEPQLAAYFKKTFGHSNRLPVDPETLQIHQASRIFAGGDIIRGAGSVVEAVADGRRAAMAINHKLRGGSIL